MLSCCGRRSLTLSHNPFSPLSPSAAPAAPVTNFEASLPSSHYARLYKEAGLSGGHVIMLGADGASAAAAREALAAYPGGLQVGGGITPATAPAWIDAGAAAVIVTSYVFRDGRLDEGRLGAMVDAVGRDRLVLDLSCRKRPVGGGGGGVGGVGGRGRASSPSPVPSADPATAAWEYVVVADRWQTFTDTAVTPATLAALGGAAGELLVHGVDVEGLRLGVDADLVGLLGAACPVPVTYAGGVAAMVRVGEGGRGVRVSSHLSLQAGGPPHLSLNPLISSLSFSLSAHLGRPGDRRRRVGRAGGRHGRLRPGHLWRGHGVRGGGGVVAEAGGGRGVSD